MIRMLELSGTISKIEKANISNVDVIFFNSKDGKTGIRMELTRNINPFIEADPVKFIFDTKPIEKPDTEKLILNSYIYSISKNQEMNIIILTAGGLQIKIETPNEYDEFKTKRALTIQIF